MVEAKEKKPYIIAIYRSDFNSSGGGTFWHYAAHFEHDYDDGVTIIEFGRYNGGTGEFRERVGGKYENEVLVTAWKMHPGPRTTPMN